MKSRPTLEFFGRAGEEELFGARSVLGSLSVKWSEIDEANLASPEKPGDILILANLRCLSPDSCRKIREWAASGGKVLAFAQSSYRDDKNRVVGTVNDFQLADLFGLHFYRWESGEPEADSIQTVPALIGQGLPKIIKLGCNTAMLVRPSDCTKVLAWWRGSGKGEPAVLMNKDSGCIYCGEDLLRPENAASAEVRFLFARLLNLLSPHIVDEDKAEKNISDLYFPPRPPVIPVKTGGPSIKVGLYQGRKKIIVGSLSGFTLTCDRKNCFTQGTGNKSKLNFGPKKHVSVQSITGGAAPYLEIKDENGGIIGKTTGRLYVSTGSNRVAKLFITRENGTFRSFELRGKLEITPKYYGLRVVNILNLEEYVAGVLPNEMPAIYPWQALCSMAVMARTFALVNIGKHRNDGYDLCSTVHCQVYGGEGSEKLRSTDACRYTRGVYISYRGRPANLTFHSTCAGIGAGTDEAWGIEYNPLMPGGLCGPGPTPDLSTESAFRKFLKNPPDCYCAGTHRFRWKEYYTLSDLTEIFSESLPETLGRNIRVGNVKALKILRRSPGGRVQALRVVTDTGEYTVYRDSIRWLFSGGHISTGGMQSTFFTIIRTVFHGEPAYEFYGGGWGHGVGLCQEGTAGMARRGMPFWKILKHYFPNCQLSRLYKVKD
ncbi:MAG: SpoIID/LytB domain-containing protein [Chloroflexi bacterium]|nr:SpoIID/LytB domain-containing protein [Chloroflexota bacterium]